MSFQESRELAIRIADGNRELLERFRVTCSELFELQVDRKEKPFSRKPPIGLRFRLASDKLLVCSPNFHYASKQVLCGSQTVELIRQERKECAGKEMFRPVKQMIIGLTEERIRLQRWFRSSLADDSLLVLTGIERFIQSPCDLLQDMSHCAICGRALTDGLSRSRGVGPECIEVVTRWPLYSNRSVIAAI